ncbi:MAG: cytidine deaminase [Desulfurococcales archaeon]|nr:cytidine deaminase [Desulfurococcales archaeon]
MSTDIDPTLLEKAKKVIENAYAPYSNFRVAALVATSDGHHYWGVNVENASYGLTICAERIAIGAALTDGKKNISQVYVFVESNQPVPPCGACRQVITEFNPDAEIIACSLRTGICKRWRAKELLPEAFTLDYIPKSENA